MSAHWSLGVLIGVPVFGLILLVLLAGGIWCIVYGFRSNSFIDQDMPLIGAAMLAVAVVLAGLLASPVGYWPFKAEYHQWRPVAGTVTQVSSRIISDGNQSVNQRFVVRFAEHESFYGCDDTRCATVKVGDHLTLSCKREWQYASVSGYGCRWLS